MKKPTFLFSTLAVCWLVLLFVASAASSQPLALNNVRPSTGDPGDRVRFIGKGFDKPAASYFALGFDGDRGFAFKVRRKLSRTRLNAAVGEVHADVDGPVVLWEGRRVALPDTDVANGSYRTRNGQVFLPSERAVGPTFKATAGEAAGFASRFVNGEIRLDLSTPNALSAASFGGAQDEDETLLFHEDTILVVVVVKTGDEPAGGDASTAAGSYGLRCIGENCLVDLARLLAESLEKLYGDRGLEARAAGSGLIVTHSANLSGGFVNVTTSSGIGTNSSQLAQGGGVTASRSVRRAVASAR